MSPPQQTNKQTKNTQKTHTDKNKKQNNNIKPNKKHTHIRRIAWSSFDISSFPDPLTDLADYLENFQYSFISFNLSFKWEFSWSHMCTDKWHRISVL